MAGLGVLVLSTEFRAGPRACRSLSAAGYRVVGADERGHGGRSLACPRPRWYPRPTGDHAAFIDAVRELCRSEAIEAVLPVSEDVARILAEDQPDLGGAIVVGPTREQYRRLCDKGRLGETAREAGVPHPETVIATPGLRLAGWPPLPSVVKPRVSGEHGDAPPALVVRSSVERDAAIATLSRAGREAIVQEQLVGTRWSVHGARSADRLLSSAIEVRATYPRDAGTSSFMRTTAPPPGLIDSTRRLLGLVDYRGPFSFNVIERDGLFFVHDVNLRLSASVGISIASGLDVPRLGVEAALGTMGSAQTRIRSRTYVSTDGEFRALVDGLRGADERPGPIAARLARALVSPGRILDPSPFDPFWLGWRTALRAVRAVRSGRPKTLRLPS